MSKDIWDILKIDDLDNPEPEGSSFQSTPKSRRQQAGYSKRSKLERYIDILKVVSDNGPIRRTHILYRANLAWGELNTFLERLIEAGALRKLVIKRGVFYEITEAGKKAIASYTEVKTTLRPEHEEEGPRMRTKGR